MAGHCSQQHAYVARLFFCAVACLPIVNDNTEHLTPVPFADRRPLLRRRRLVQGHVVGDAGPLARARAAGQHVDGGERRAAGQDLQDGAGFSAVRHAR